MRESQVELSVLEGGRDQGNLWFLEVLMNLKIWCYGRSCEFSFGNFKMSSLSIGSKIYLQYIQILISLNFLQLGSVQCASII